jgi:hypothetical protein
MFREVTKWTSRVFVHNITVHINVNSVSLALVADFLDLECFDFKSLNTLRTGRQFIGFWLLNVRTGRKLFGF